MHLYHYVSVMTNIEYIGCFNEKDGNRDLNEVSMQLADNTPKKCIFLCYIRGMQSK